jgi:hypothetical protein
MNSLVNLLADYIQLDFEREEGVVYEKPRRLSHLAAVIYSPLGRHWWPWWIPEWTSS